MLMQNKKILILSLRQVNGNVKFGWKLTASANEKTESQKPETKSKKFKTTA